jgi:predicted ATPase
MILDFLAATRPIVVVIDDLQWADEASLHLFHYLSRQVTGNRILLLGITRTDRFDLHKDGKPGIVVDILARMRREGLCKDVTLNRLCRESCDALIDKSLTPNLFTPEFYADIYAGTKGNPLFVTETLKLLFEKEVIYSNEETWYNKENQFELTAVPDRVEDIFIRRLSSLTAEEYEILQIAAVQGYRFDASLISKVMESSKIELLKTLQRIERNSEVIVSNDRGFQFEHPILADIIYNDIPGALSREYHLMMAAELEKIYSPDFGALVGDIAQHYRRGGNHTRAIPLLHQAGLRTFGLSAYSEACLYFENLLDSLACSGQTIPEAISESDLYLKLGKCYEEGGRWEEGLDAYNKLYAISKESLYAEGQTDALIRMGRLYGKLGDWKLAIAKYQECLDIAKQHDLAAVLSKIYNNLGIIYLQKGEFDQALQHFNDTLATVDNEPGDIFKAHALTNIGIIANIRHEHQTAMDNYKKALVIYQQKETCQQDQARIYHNLGMTLADIGEWQEASAAFQDCVKFATEVQDKQLLAMAYLNMAKTLVRQDKLTAAKKHTEKAVKMFKRMDDMLNVAEAYHIFGLIHSAQSQYSEALKFINDSIHINRELGYQEGLAEAYMAHGKVSQEAGELAQARASYEQALEAYRGLHVHSKTEEIITVIDGLPQPETAVRVENRSKA